MPQAIKKISFDKGDNNGAEKKAYTFMGKTGQREQEKSISLKCFFVFKETPDNDGQELEERDEGTEYIVGLSEHVIDV